MRLIAAPSFCLEQAREDKAKKEPTSILHGLLKLNSHLEHIMENGILQATARAVVMFAIGFGTVALANEAKANSEDRLLPTTEDDSGEQINKVIEPGQHCFPPYC